MYLARVDKEVILKRSYRKRSMQYDEAKRALDAFVTGKYGKLVEAKDLYDHWNNNNDMCRTLNSVAKKYNMSVKVYMLNGNVYVEDNSDGEAGINGENE